ncbi:prevent-host-death family protein [Desulfonatronospira thiodismutans ASO3-1]|uniref:Prevent-host-death family protein n=1 Tax=Desulfonatronospira thiodismutans ASO3-1 TaxID=555779 RepID=D6SK56_9BACT|nr:type II toxin-antitoxin system prevent-host-death family antitoxin [Desulfonatronospira thiodismutans]EFI36259.1 prevent-host-death family protein [Desulfonatronospira thiodismutans ASO3-1]
MMVNVHEAKTNFSNLLEMAHAGQEIILAKSGKPYALLTPLPSGGVAQRKPGRLPGKVTESFFEPLPEEEIAAWERT